MRSKKPTFQQGSHTMYTWKQRRSILPTSLYKPGFVLVARFSQPRVSLPPVSDDRRTRFNGLLHERLKIPRGGIPNPAQSNTSDALAVDLGRYGHQGFISPLSARFSCLHATHVGFVYFDFPGQPVTTGANHRSAELVKPNPRRFVSAKSQLPFQPQSTAARFGARHQPQDPKPQSQGLPRPIKDRAGRDGGLSFTRRTEPRPPLRSPSLGPLARRATKASWPTKRLQIPSTSLLGGKAPLKLNHRGRIIFIGSRAAHTPKHYPYGLLESTG